jgi:predicted MFS family arabinose efflux permease
MGYAGPPVAALVASMLAFGCSLVATERLMGITPDGRRISPLLAANAAFAASLWLLLTAEFPWLLAMVISLGMYPVWSVMLGVVKRGELQRLLHREPTPTKSLGGLEVQ